MMTQPAASLLLLACGFAAAGAIGYALWVPLRVIALKIELLGVLGRARAKLATLGGVDRPDWVRLDAFVRELYCEAGNLHLSTATLDRVEELERSIPREAMKLPRPTDMAGLEEQLRMLEIELAYNDTMTRVIHYLIRRTLTGILCSKVLRMIPTPILDAWASNKATARAHRISVGGPRLA